MSTPALKRFLAATGHVVHHLNTITVGLSAVESGGAAKPAGMDITWAPRDLRTSSRQARVFALQASITFLAEHVNTYLGELAKYPPISPKVNWNAEKKKADRLVALHDWLEPAPSYLLCGCLLVLHWRNRIVHSKSNAGLTDAQRKAFANASSEIMEKYRNLDPVRTLEDFDNGTPTLKDVSSLTAMTIRYVKALDAAVPEPQSGPEFLAWLEALGLRKDFDRARKVAASQGKEERGMASFVHTHCPSLSAACQQYVTESVGR